MHVPTLLLRHQDSGVARILMHEMHILTLDDRRETHLHTRLLSTTWT